MHVIWTVARQTFLQCIRSRAVMVTLTLLAMLLVSMPFVLKGDETLAGRIRTFLAYSASIVTMVLSVLTVFFSVLVISEDVRTRRVFALAVKPVARWQYVLGRWLGVSLLNAVLLVIAGGGIYVLAQQMRAGAMGPPVNPTDRATVETEVFTARKRVHPVIELDVDEATQQRLAMMAQEGTLESALAIYQARYPDEEQAMAALYEEIWKQISQWSQSIGPGDDGVWRFEGIDLHGSTMTAQGKVLLAPKGDNAGRYRIKAKPRVLGKLVYRTPLQINGVDAWVTALDKDYVEIKLREDMADTSPVAMVTKGDTVTLTIEPTLQLTYEVSPAASPPDGRLMRMLWVLNPETRFSDITNRLEPVRQPVTTTVPGRVVGRAVSRSRWVAWRTKQLMREDGLSREDAEAKVADEPSPPLATAPESCIVMTTEVLYRNATSTSVTILNEDISILFKVSSFEANFVRGLWLIQVQLMYLAALGLVAGSFLTFPVGVLSAMTTLPFALARAGLMENMQGYADSVTWQAFGQVWKHVFASIWQWEGYWAALRDVTLWSLRAMMYWMMKGMVFLMPNLEAGLTGKFWVDGMVIGWGFLTGSSLVTMGLHTTLLLGLACWIYTRRELARVQV